MKLKKKKKKNYFSINLIKNFLNYFFEKNLSKKSIFLLKNYRYKIKKTHIFKKIKKKLFSLNKIRSIRFFRFKDFNLIFCSFFFKDINLFKDWLHYRMKKLPFKRHRRFLYYLKVFLSKFFFPYISIFNMCGYYIRVKGKISLGGNSKKKTYIIKQGKFARYEKFYKLYYTDFNVFTLPGALGFKLILLYN